MNYARQANTFVNEACPAKLKAKTDKSYDVFVYLIKSVNFPEQTYVGYTTDLKKRLVIHNSGGSVHTAKYKPWNLHAYFAFTEESQALKFEKYLKSHSGRAFAKKRLW